MKKAIIILSFFLFYSTAFAYEKGKIDTHGGKSDPLTTNNGGFLNQLGLLAEKIKKEDKKEIKKTDKKFIEIDKIENIEQEGLKEK